MPLSNPFRRAADRPTLRERAADLKAGLSRAIRRPVPEPASAPAAAPADDVADFAKIEFGAYTFDFPLKTPQEWAARLGQHSLAMHLADRTVRMTKPELIAFIREEGEQDAEIPTAIFHALDAAGETFEGWGNLLRLARARFIVAGSAEFVEAGFVPQEAPADATMAAMPAPGSEEAVAAFRAAYHEHTFRTQFANEYPDLKRTALEWWTADTLAKAMETGEITPTECARLHPRATERELRMRQIEHELKLGALHALAFADSYPLPQDEADEPAPTKPGGIDFGPDAHIAELATEFCRAYARNAEADRAMMDGTLPEAEWEPIYRETTALMGRLERVEPKTILGMALKCLGPIGAAAWDVPRDGDHSRLDRWERLGAQFEAALVDGRLAPLASIRPTLAGMIDVTSVTLRDLRSLHDVANEVGSIAYAMASSGRGEGRRVGPGFGCHFNAAGELMQWLGDELAYVEHAAISEARRRVPETDNDREIRLQILALPTLQNDDPAEIAAFARELLASVCSANERINSRQ